MNRTDDEKTLLRLNTAKMLKDLRREKGLSTVDVAKALGVTPNYISEIERALKIPSDQLIIKLSNYFCIDCNELFYQFGKEPLSARKEFEGNKALHSLLIEIGSNNKLSDEEKEKIYDQLYKTYHALLEGRK